MTLKSIMEWIDYVISSSASFLCFLLFLGFLSLVLGIALLDLAANLRHLNVVDVIIILLEVLAVWAVPLSIGFIFTAFSSRLYPNILRWIRLFVELVGEILGHNETTVFVVFLQNYLLKLFADGVHDLLEAESHAFISEFTNVLVELFVNFLGYPMSPGGHLVVYQLNLLVYFFSLLAWLLASFNLLWKRGQFRWKLGLSTGVDLILLLILIVMHL